MSGSRHRPLWALLHGLLAAEHRKKAEKLLEGAHGRRLPDGHQAPCCKARSLPAGRPTAWSAEEIRRQAAYQIVNDSEAVLRYLCFSTMEAPNVMIYSDSGKVGIFCGAASRDPKEERTLLKVLQGNAEVGYYDGEE